MKSLQFLAGFLAVIILGEAKISSDIKGSGWTRRIFNNWELQDP